MASDMGAPRRVLPGKTYLITRRCYQRTFRLRPSAQTNQVFLYCLAWAAQKTGVVVHAVCVMSNHHHMVVTDVDGVLPDFLRELHRTVAKALNAAQRQWENLWNVGPTSVVLLPTLDDVLRKIGYVVANPVESGLVEQPAQWPGVLLWGEHRRMLRRPERYFHPDGASPEAIELVITAPTESLALPDWAARVAGEIASQVSDAHRSMSVRGLRFLGRAAVLAVSFVARAKSYEVKRRLAPTVAAACRDVRIRVLKEWRWFQGEYGKALAAWRGGERVVVFPNGTWWMRVHHAAQVAA